MEDRDDWIDVLANATAYLLEGNSGDAGTQVFMLGVSCCARAWCLVLILGVSC